MGIAAHPPRLLPTPGHSCPAVPSRARPGSARTALSGRTSQACLSRCSGKYGSGNFLCQLAPLSAAWGFIQLSPPSPLGLPSGTSSKEPACPCRGQKRQVRSVGREDPLEEGMATHSSILAWRVPWTEEPGGLQSMGLQRVRRVLART